MFRKVIFISELHFAETQEFLLEFPQFYPQTLIFTFLFINNFQKMTKI